MTLTNLAPSHLPRLVQAFHYGEAILELLRQALDHGQSLPQESETSGRSSRLFMC